MKCPAILTNLLRTARVGGPRPGTVQKLCPSGRATTVVLRRSAAATRAVGWWGGDEEWIQVRVWSRARTTAAEQLPRVLDRLRDARSRGVAAEPLARPFRQILGGQRPQQLLHVAAVGLERLREHAFGLRADFLERAVAAPVVGDRTRFEAMHVQNLEGEARSKHCRFREDASAPECRAEREAPIRDEERRILRAQLNQAGRFVETVRHDAEARALAPPPLAMRPRDESFECLDRGGRRGDVRCDCWIGQQLHECPGVARTQLAETDRFAFERRQRHAPTGFVDDVKHVVESLFSKRHATRARPAKPRDRRVWRRRVTTPETHTRATLKQPTDEAGRSAALCA